MLRLFAATTAGILVVAAFLAHAGPTAGVNEIRLRVDPNELNSAVARNAKYDFKHAEANVNGSGPFPAFLKIRGQRCLIAARKCFGLKLDSPVAIQGEQDFSSKNLNLVSMWRDQGYISSKIGFDMFRKLGLFNLRTEYAELFINDESQGLYLITEKANAAIERGTPGAFVGRRRAGARLQVTASAAKGASHRDAEYVAAFKGLYTDVRDLRGEALRARVEQSLDLKSYMSWLLVNSLLMNGDFSDEMFFYADPRERQIHFSVFPWDLDDLFRLPHPMAANRRYAAEISHGLLYSYEDPLDEKIGIDPALNAEFQQVAGSMLNTQLTDQLVDDVVDAVGDSITPYLDRESVFEESRLDGDEPYTREGILRLLEKRRVQIKTRRDQLKARLARSDGLEGHSFGIGSGQSGEVGFDDHVPEHLAEQ